MSTIVLNPEIKRALFAAMAMQSLIGRGHQPNEDMAKYAVQYADALLKKLEETKQK